MLRSHPQNGLDICLRGPWILTYMVAIDNSVPILGFLFLTQMASRSSCHSYESFESSYVQTLCHFLLSESNAGTYRSMWIDFVSDYLLKALLETLFDFAELLCEYLHHPQYYLELLILNPLWRHGLF